VLEDAGVEPDTVEIVFTGADHGIEGGEELDYARSLALTEAMRPEVLLAYEMNGRPLEPQHGFPVRLLVPGWYGMTSVKWLSRIEAVTEPFRGFHQAIAYHYQQSDEDPGEPVTRIRPRALLQPPGWPDFMTRERFLRAGPVVLTGRAWSGRAPVTRVEVSTDGGDTWADAELAPASGHPFAWRSWRYAWDAAPGEHELCCRAADAEGNAQPVDAEWNVGGYANTSVQRVPVTVRSGIR
jgi:DMSO/TMAO reductase YedYZ molybdopterin-dependent catalytic subunit